MKIKFPLYAKILFWFFLNIIFLGAVFIVVAHGQFRFGLDSLISGPAGDRLQSATQLLTSDLRDRARSDWDAVLKRYSDAYNVQFYLFHDRGQLAGAAVSVPDEVWNRIPGPRERNLPPPPGNEEVSPPSQGQLEPPPGPPRENGPRPFPGEGRKFMVHTSSPSRYWVVMRIVIPPMERPLRPEPLTLIVASDSVSGGGLFFDLTTWVIAGAAVVIVSVLFWMPLVRGITRSISRMTLATEKIAEGHFEVRTQVKRQDELGSLSDAINRMAMRLSGFVAGQKRFLGDIAHELCSPIARIQVALGILEQRADDKQKEYLNDLREEVEQMSNLVNELLSFSKASLGGKAIKLQAVSLKATVEKAVSRECGAGNAAEIKVAMPEDLQVEAEPELLVRAIGNILRNAIRYAAKAGPITISEARARGGIELVIEDCGPGIPEGAIGQVFDPFFRVDTSRDRETGGVGLGLSIVKTCVESCGGTVRCENRATGGLKVTVVLRPTE